MRFEVPGFPEIQEAAMKYGMFGIMMPVLCGKVLIPYAKEKVPGFDKRKVMAEYKGMIARNPDIGTGKTNPLLAGLYLAAYILAFHKAYPAQIGGEEIGELVDILGESSVMKRLYAGKDFLRRKILRPGQRWRRNQRTFIRKTGSMNFGRISKSGSAL